MVERSLSPVYLNNRPVELPREPKPRVAQVVEAGGQSIDQVEVQWLESRSDARGRTLGASSVLDRTSAPTQPIYLVTKRRPPAVRRPAPYTPQSFERLIGTPGFSDELLHDHFQLYEGYVTHTNQCVDLLRSSSLDAYVASELRRRLGWEFNGMRLHELYFGGMGSDRTELAENSGLASAIVSEFGSYERWWTLFQALGATRGIGWAMLAHDPVANRLFNVWVNEHDTGVLAGSQPLLVLDVFEHAYWRDYGLDRAAYLKAFALAIDWNVAERRWQRSSSGL